MKIIYQRISALLFVVILLSIISCNKSNYPSATLETTLQKENSLSAINENNPGNSPSGLFQSETLNEELKADSTPILSVAKTIVSENSSEKIPLIKSVKDVPQTIVDEKDDDYPTQRDVNEALFVSILGLLLVPT